MFVYIQLNFVLKLLPIVDTSRLHVIERKKIHKIREHEYRQRKKKSKQIAGIIHEGKTKN